MSPPSLPVIPVKQGMPCLEQGCSACCHDTEMLLTLSDVERIQAARPDTQFHFVADDGFLQLRTRDAPPVSGWQGGPSQSSTLAANVAPRPCIFLNNVGHCSIHDVRPEGCRLYPGVWDEEIRKAALDAEHCPHTAGFNLAAGTKDALQRLATRLVAERDARVG